MGATELFVLSIAATLSFVNFVVAILEDMAYQELKAEVERLKKEVIEERFRRRMDE